MQTDSFVLLSLKSLTALTCRKVVAVFLSLISFALSPAVMAEQTETINQASAVIESPQANGISLSSVQLLNNMQDAVLSQNYQISFINTENGKLTDAFKFRHIIVDDKPLAQLLYLDGPAKEILLRNNIVSYFQLDNESFSLNSSRIIEAFPDVVFNNFNTLANYYDFFPLGKARAANRSCQLVRIVSKDKDRYSYIIWIDDKTFLPLRVDLFDMNNALLEQFKVVELESIEDPADFENYVTKTPYPVLLAAEDVKPESDTWELTTLPAGFKELSYSSLNFQQETISSKLFSDGVFSFTINVSNSAGDNKNHAILRGSRTIYNTHSNDKDIVIIGNLPLETIQQIAKNIVIITH
ncbi:MucB/RseB C-terminal domain-containing protein [Zophobihabitans entericus]|uniref:Sigma-E factor regulatory protein RseB n=1 Tax=Zophobihabitans entericus TaxID=1635327 RepID=A0A6G9ID94_9GAMM|nr:MucB/RseB C-terminal domain-containing protein [Zophobihabitans entericus]QIQ21792.1 sigma-E factor regulatory protein RseB [Zophobihabitans entericus]